MVSGMGQDICHYVHQQLPRALQNRLAVELVTDAYHLRTVAHFKDETSGREFKVALERDRVGGHDLAVKIPDTFLAHLSAVL